MALPTEFVCTILADQVLVDHFVHGVAFNTKWGKCVSISAHIHPKWTHDECVNAFRSMLHFFQQHRPAVLLIGGDFNITCAGENRISLNAQTAPSERRARAWAEFNSIFLF